MKHLTAALLVLALFAGCDRKKATGTLAQARTGFKTHLMQQLRDGTPVADPPRQLFKIVHYTSPAGSLSAYLTPDPHDGSRHPAIVWITGGDCNTIGDVWSPATRDNDQSAAAYRQAGMIMMFPALRGGNDNPGAQEKFFGELDDVVAAGDFLAAQPYVDPTRIYLGGHSSGGTLVLLVAEYSTRFRAVFSFGPIDNVARYGGSMPLPFDVNDQKELDLRSPVLWVDSIKTPTFIFEGERGNLYALNQIASAASGSSFVHAFPIHGQTHFSILSPVNQLIAEKIKGDVGAQTNISFSPDELARRMER